MHYQDFHFRIHDTFWWNWETQFNFFFAQKKFSFLSLGVSNKKSLFLEPRLLKILPESIRMSKKYCWKFQSWSWTRLKRLKILFRSKTAIQIILQRIFLILAFSTNCCPTKTDLSGNTVWPQASKLKKLAKIDHFWHF